MRLRDGRLDRPTSANLHGQTVPGTGRGGPTDVLKGEPRCTTRLRSWSFMKGVILAGGTGSRLFPLTKVTNKHLLPVYNKPMIYYPIECMVNAGIDEVLLVTGGNNAGDFIRLLGNGRELGLKELNYTYQDGAGGIAQALGLAEHFAEGDSICLILGDNIVEYTIGEARKRFRHQGEGAKILLSQVENPRAYGVAEMDGDRVVKIVEKPQNPKSNWAVIGIYFY